MSYFAAGFRVKPSQAKCLEESLSAVVPPQIRTDIFRLEKTESFLLSYGAKKPIADYVIQDSQTDSWLAILGTPLVRLSEHESSRSLLGCFFSNPEKVIKNDLDGCFAVVGYNSLIDTYYAGTDYNNTIPLFYAETTDGFFLSSHELPLARFLHADIDTLGFALTIHLKLAWGEHTRFKNIKKMLPSHLATFSKTGPLSHKSYWSPSEEHLWPNKFDLVFDEWSTILRSSVEAYSNSSEVRPIVCDITAGEDSRLLLAQCHALGIPFVGMVDGSESDVDVRVASEASRKTGFELNIRPRQIISNNMLSNYAIDISLHHEANEDFFFSCAAFATDAAVPSGTYDFIKLCGAPGGEVFRGSYYLRGKAFFPSHAGRFDHVFFTRMKYLLDFRPGLLRFPDQECKSLILSMVEKALEDVSDFPVGTRIDHLLRVFQSCNTGLIYKNPRYLPFSTRSMTRSIYRIPPHFKKGGRLTKACTESLFPELAWIRTQKGVPTVKKTMLRTFLFSPEYFAAATQIARGAFSRLLKWTKSNKPAYQWDINAPALETLLNTSPYDGWFSTPDSMMTGFLYRADALDAMLREARGGSSRNLPTLGRVFSQELACRWVYHDNYS